MKQKVLQSIGFTTINRTPSEVKKVNQEQIVVSSRARSNADQISLSIPREMLNKLNWEISQKVKILFNATNQAVAVIRAKDTDKDSFIISCQGSTQEEAIQMQRGGVVRFAWRDNMGEKPAFQGQVKANVSRDRSTLIVDMQQALAA